jgi:hypothetical protein
MSWVIAIPSYNRVKTLKEKTLKVLQEHGIPTSKIYVFVANEEQKELYEEVRGLVGDIIVGVKGLAEVRNFITDYFPEGTKLVGIDDDIRNFIEYDSEAHRKEKPLISLENVIERGFLECEKSGARLWGIYPSANGYFMKPTVTTDLRFIVGCFYGCINTRDRKLPFGSHKDDYQRTIIFWEADNAVVRLNFIAPKTAYYKEPGGLQEDGRDEREKQAVERMLEKWPQYVKLNPRRKSGYTEIRLKNPLARHALF